ncbi:MAG: Rpn family recombination-promoting nuclease/putative transposase [Thermodesulfobacteriota bacterium]|nr:Rpn family recombination-promoting nuclease/putative transposase [Thermodesulfobacteriota bacterium]
MTEITNPHDRFFKEVLTRGNTAKQFLENYLPHDVTKLLDLDSLEYTKDTFIDKHLKEYFSDLLLKTYLKDGSRGYVYILFEHKSYQEPLTAFHLLRYMVKIWEMSLKNGETPGFPVIIPLVFYHGEKRWRAGLRARQKITSHFRRRCIPPDCVAKILNMLDIHAFSRLVSRAPQHLKLRTYSLPNPKSQKSF